MIFFLKVTYGHDLVMVYCIYCGLKRLELQAKHQLHGHAPVPAARPILFTLFNCLEFSWAIRRAHNMQTLLRTREPPLYCSSPLLIRLGLARIQGWHRLDFCLFFDGHRGRQQKERSRKVMCLHWGHGREL
jgi:hypothetical protein